MPSKDKERESEIETLQMMVDAECLVVANMEAEGEQDIDRRPLRALVAGLRCLRDNSS
jgi:hypothetical protein